MGERVSDREANKPHPPGTIAEFDPDSELAERMIDHMCKTLNMDRIDEQMVAACFGQTIAALKIIGNYRVVDTYSVPKELRSWEPLKGWRDDGQRVYQQRRRPV
jgi:hypothetical protein